MDNFPITFGLWIFFVLIVVVRKICIGRRRALQRQREEENGGIHTSTERPLSSIIETPEERREKIDQTLITRHVVSKGDISTTTEGHQEDSDWWKTFRAMGTSSRVTVQFSEPPPGTEDRWGDLEQGNCEGSTREPKSDNQEAPQTNAVFDAISTSLRSMVAETSQTVSCDICLAEYEVGEQVSWSPNKECPHAFHRECISDWLMTKSTCPCCRRNYLMSGHSLDSSTEDNGSEDIPALIRASSNEQ